MTASKKQPGDVYTLARELLTTLFGRPERKDAATLSWRLGGKTTIAGINLVLVELPAPALWVFDPSDHSEGLKRYDLTDAQQVAALITDIQKQAGYPDHAKPM